MSVVVVSDDESAESEAEEVGKEVADAVEEMGDAIEDVAQDNVNLELVERVTRLEDAQAILTGVVEGLAAKVESMEFHEEMQDASIAATQEEIVEVATEAADAIEETAEDIEEASPEIEPDEVPTTTEHPFFRRWGSRK